VPGKCLSAKPAATLGSSPVNFHNVVLVNSKTLHKMCKVQLNSDLKLLAARPHPLSLALSLSLARSLSLSLTNTHTLSLSLDRVATRVACYLLSGGRAINRPHSP
jgi:hypothetical protein